VDIAAWLRELGLERYEEAFQENEIHADILPTLTAEDLKDLGVNVVGHRRRMLNAIADLRAHAGGPGTDAASEPREEIRGHAERRQLTVLLCDHLRIGKARLEDFMASARSHRHRPRAPAGSRSMRARHRP
jgi:hypothetical protein